MAENHQVLTRPLESALATNSVIRNTYILLSLTLLFSALVLMRMRAALAEMRIEARMRRMAES